MNWTCLDRIGFHRCVVSGAIDGLTADRTGQSFRQLDVLRLAADEQVVLAERRKDKAEDHIQSIPGRSEEL